MKKKVLLIVGPTGVGKTALSLELAKQLDAEIVSADSRQVYRYMNIGTAKPSPEQLAAVPHHFIDIVDPDKYYSAGQFGREARAVITDILKRGKQPLVVGGSGLYIRALVDGLFEPKIADDTIKGALKEEARHMGIPAMYEKLQRVDPATAEQLHPTDTQRILRALEVYQITGRPFSEYLKIPPQPAEFEPVFIGLFLERRKLYARIEARLDAMIAAGFMEEVKELQQRGYSLHLNALQTVGYKEAFQFLHNEIAYSAMMNLIKQKSRNYAKRQLTWFRKDPRVQWLDVGSFASITDLAGEISRALSKDFFLAFDA